MSPLQRRRIALVPSSFHPYFGGVEEHTRQVAKGLLARGHAVEVWTVDRGERLGVQEVDGVRVRYLRTPLPARRAANLARFAVMSPPAFATWLSAALRFRPDVLHVQCFGPNGIYATALSRLLRRPLVISSHGETFADEHDVFGRSALMQRGLSAGCQQAAVTTGCSVLVTHDLATRFGARDALIVPNGVELIGSPQRAKVKGRVPTIVAVGRLVHVKGFDLLIRAVAQLDRPVQLVLVGEGSAHESLEALAREVGISDSVKLVGRQDQPEVRRLMSESDVVAVPSRAESFGIVALEAWDSGTPLIATSLGGPRGFVTDGVDGLLVDPENTPALAAAIDRVLSDEDLARRLADAGRESVKQFTWDRVVDDYERIYEVALEKS